MYYKTLTSILISLFTNLILMSQEPLRVWTDSKGRTIDAKFIKFSGVNVIIQKNNNRKYEVNPSLFSQNDQDYIRLMKSKYPTTPNGRPLDRNYFRSILVREKKWTNEIGTGLQRFFFDFDLDKVDADRDGSPEGSKVFVKQMWFQGKEQILKGKITGGQGCLGFWKVDDAGNLDVTLLKCHPDGGGIPDALGSFRDGPKNLRYYYGAGYPPRSLCNEKRPHPHTSICGCPFHGSGTWKYHKSSGNFNGGADKSNWRATILPFKRAIELAK